MWKVETRTQKLYFGKPVILKIRNPAYRGGKRSARKNQFATGLAPRVFLALSPEDLNFQSVPGAKFFLPGPLSFFVKESSALRGCGTRSPSPRRSIKRFGVNGNWPGVGGERSVSDYSDAARGSRGPGAPSSRLAAAALHARPPLRRRPRGPTQGAPAGGWPGAARAGRLAGRAAGSSWNALQQAGGPAEQLRSFSVCAGITNLTGGAQGFVCYRQLLGDIRQ